MCISKKTTLLTLYSDKIIMRYSSMSNFSAAMENNQDKESIIVGNLMQKINKNYLLLNQVVTINELIFKVK